MNDIEYIPAKTIVVKTKSQDWFGADYNMNIYRGCCHGCIYCDSRSECYRVEDFDTVRAKKDALAIIKNELRKKSGVVATGAMSDPYNPHEERLELTRGALELLQNARMGVAACTKSPLVSRDAQLYADISRHSPVLVKMTVTTADDALCRLIEPNVAPSSERFAAMARLAQAGVYCGVLLMPLLPLINDTPGNVRSVVRAAKDSGARFVYGAFGVTLRQNQRDYFFNRLDETFPGMRSEYVRRFGTAYSCASPRARELYAVFNAECQKLGLLNDMRSIIADYKRGYEPEQTRLF